MTEDQEIEFIIEEDQNDLNIFMYLLYMPIHF